MLRQDGHPPEAICSPPSGVKVLWIDRNAKAMGGETDKVSLVRCEDYEPEDVMGAVRRSIDLLGGLDRFIAPGEKVLVKPNLLLMTPPERCVTTHPEVVYAVAKLLRDHGCEVVIADSTGGATPYTTPKLRKLYEVTGMAEAAERAGASLGVEARYKDVPCPEGKVVRSFQVIAPAAEADAIVVVSKAKTHVLTTMTGGTKCIFGVLPGMEKPSFHGRLPDLNSFNDMLLDLNAAMKPRLQIMDAVLGMEGEGPSGGEPRHIGAILASGNCVSLDIVAATLMSFRPQDIPTLQRGAERGWANKDLQVTVLGEDPGDLAVKDFKHPPRSGNDPLGGRLFGRLLRSYALRPSVAKERCIGCGICAASCPQRTIMIVNGKARVKYDRCIRCYCCHEMCPERAISLERSLGGRMIARIMEDREARS